MDETIYLRKYRKKLEIYNFPKIPFEIFMFFLFDRHKRQARVCGPVSILC